MLEPIFAFLVLIIILPFITWIYWIVLLATMIADKFCKHVWLTALVSLSVSAISFYLYCRYNPGYLELNLTFWPFYAAGSSINALILLWLKKVNVNKRKNLPRAKNTNGGE